jgi:hypothetical protein
VEAAKQRDITKRAAIIAAGREGKSVVQTKKSATRSVDGEEEIAMLIYGKRRIKRTVEALTRRLEEIERRLRTRGDEGGGES